jgi:hypothetical protein
MARRLFKYAGRFQIWSYTVSHGQLLLRSTRSPERATQIDVLFKNVSALSLSTTFDGLEVFDDEDAVLPVFAKPIHGRRVFIVRACDVEYYVVAGAVFHVESQASHNDSSPLQPTFPPVE